MPSLRSRCKLKKYVMCTSTGCQDVWLKVLTACDDYMKKPQNITVDIVKVNIIKQKKRETYNN